MKDFFDALASDGGHIVVLLIIIHTGVFMLASGLPDAKEVMIGALCALYAILKPVTPR